ncbi:unnamed protein product, partial [Ectocarpus fasciculatus]
QDPSAFELALARVNWDSASIRGVIVNFVCRSLLWGSWVTHHFYAIVKGKGPGDDDDDDDDGVSPARGGEGGLQTAAAEGGGGTTRHLECGAGGVVGTGENADGGREGDDGEETGCLEKLSPLRRRGKNNRARNRNSSDQGSCCAASGTGAGSDGGGATGGAAWYSLDSRIPKPQRLGGTRGLVEHLAWEVREHHGHVFVIGGGAEAVAGVGDDGDGHAGPAENRV